MTPKQRMMAALHRQKPDRLPVTIHQWQQYHLDTYLGGMDALAACKTCGLDASIQYFEAMGQWSASSGSSRSRLSGRSLICPHYCRRAPD